MKYERLKENTLTSECFAAFLTFQQAMELICYSLAGH